MKIICPINQCTGCAACFNVCRHSAIEMKSDKYGFAYPEIDQNKCIDCGLCQKSCPNVYKLAKNNPLDCYVCHAQDSSEQISSTSGGIASAISRFIIRRGGIVYGCSAVNCYDIKHLRIENESQLDLLKGSKYVQSQINDIFIRIKQDLKDGKEVLFIGTPCQVAGLKGFLRKEYEKLYTIDFVCHGVPSFKYLQDTFPNKIRTSSLNYNLQFRNKVEINRDEFKTEYGLFFLDNNREIVYKEKYPNSLYMMGFLQGLFYRESCYKCHYATSERVSDFTVGDYDDKENLYNGLPGIKKVISMMMVNTQKAKQLMIQFDKTIFSIPVTLDNLIQTHEQLSKPMSRHKNYQKFRELYQTDGIKIALKISLHDDIIINRKKKIKKLLFNIPCVEFLHRILYKK